MFRGKEFAIAVIEQRLQLITTEQRMLPSRSSCVEPVEILFADSPCLQVFVVLLRSGNWRQNVERGVIGFKSAQDVEVFADRTFGGLQESQ